MKLYYGAGACSMSPEIVAAEAGLDLTRIKVDIHKHVLADGGDYHAVNSKGSVPVLGFDDGSMLTEGPVIVQYLADQVPASGLIPPAGTLARYRVQEWLNFLTSEVHKTMGPLFDKSTPPEVRTATLAKVGHKIEWVATQLGNKQYLMGDQFTVADAYLFTLLSWHDWLKLDLSQWPVIARYFDRVKARPAVAKVLAANGRSNT